MNPVKVEFETIDKWHGIFYRPSRTDTAGHTKAFDYPVVEHWGKSRNVQFREWDSNRQHIDSQSNVLPTEPSRFPEPSTNEADVRIMMYGGRKILSVSR